MVPSLAQIVIQQLNTPSRQAGGVFPTQRRGGKKWRGSTLGTMWNFLRIYIYIYFFFFLNLGLFGRTYLGKVKRSSQNFWDNLVVLKSCSGNHLPFVFCQLLRVDEEVVLSCFFLRKSRILLCLTPHLEAATWLIRLKCYIPSSIASENSSGYRGLTGSFPTLKV